MLKKIISAINLSVIGFMMLFQALQAKAAWGDYDTSFGFGGVSVDSVTGYVPKGVAIQPDDKMVSVGVYDNKLILARTLPD